MAVKFLSDGHFSGSSTDLTLDGQLFLPSYTSSPAVPTISFDSNAGGIWYDSNDDQIWFRAGNSNRAYINSSGVVSQANVYTGTNNEFRNYAGVWKATTGQTGNGFQFINSVDGTALTLSSTGNAVFTGSVTATSFVKSGGTSSQFLMADGSVSTGGSGISQADADVRYVNVTGDTMTGNLSIESGAPVLTLKDTTDDDDQQINFLNNGGTVEYVIRTRDFTTANTGDGMFIGSISSDPLALVTNNTTALTIDTSQRVGIGTSPNEKLHVEGTTRFNGDVHIGGSAGGFVYRPVESNSAIDRYFLMFDYTNNASYPFLTNRTPNGAVVIKTGSAAGSGENEHFRIKGGDGTVDAYFTNTNLGIGTPTPATKLDINGVLYSRGGTWNGGGSESNSTIVGAVIQEGHFIFTKDGNNLRRLIGKTSDIIEIGQNGTSLIDGISFLSGTTPLYRWYNNTSEIMRLNATGLGIGTNSPLEKLHVRYSDTAGISTVYSKGLIEDTDAQLDLLSTSDGTWGSAINFVESAGGDANTDVWSIARKTTGGSGDSSLNFNFGTNNQHDNTNRISFSSTGDLTVQGGDIILGGTGRIQGIDTVSAGTDAVNKTYVDNAISGITEQDTLDTVADRGAITDNTITVNGLRTNADSTYDIGQNGTRFATAFVDNIQLKDYIKNNTAAYINYISNQGHRFFVDANGDDTSHQFQILSNTDTYAANNVVFKVEQTGDTSIYGDIIGSGNLFLRSYNNDPKGIFFRDGFEYGDTNQYNLSITVYDDGDGSADAMNINAYDGIYFNVQSGTTPSTAFRVLNGEVRSYKTLIADSTFQMNDSNTNLVISGNTSGNATIDNNTGSIAFQANGSTVNSMTITSSLITLNENTTVTGTLDPQGNILGAVVDDGNSANPLQVRRSSASTMQVGINFTVSPTSGSGFSRYLGVDSSADLRFGSNTNHAQNALVLTTANYVSQFASFAGDIIPSADSTYDLGSNATKWAEGHFDHLFVGETGNNPRIDIYTENGTTSVADTFADTSTDKSYIYFQAGTNSNDPGYIMHETSESASPNEQNEGVLHLVPSDDNSTGDYVSIHGTNDADCIKLHTSGLIETANYQLQLKSDVGDVYINDGLTVNGTIAATGGTSTTWNEAHDNMIISASVSGTSTKTLTLNQNDGGTITASWTDLQGTTISAPNAPTNLSLSIVNNTVNVTFNASSTSGIDQYLVFGSANGGDYSLISVIEPASMGSTMSVIDDSFDDSGTQAYRVYAMKTGVMSSALSGSVTYTVSTPVEPTNMSVVNLNTAFYIQWDPPSSNARFVTAYNVYKHEHATQGSLSRSSATLIYSGMNTSYMYEISGNNNLNYHQFWVETTVT